jgi:curved DNA-binding protein CbpA
MHRVATPNASAWPPPQRAKALHPDQAGASPADVEQFLALVKAYETLSDPQQRQVYDATRRWASPPASGVRLCRRQHQPFCQCLATGHDPGCAHPCLQRSRLPAHSSRRDCSGSGAQQRHRLSQQRYSRSSVAMGHG